VFKIELSKQADRFTEREGITDDEIFSMIQKLIDYFKGLDVNIDVKRMKGKWRGYHRIRIGKIRMLLRINFKERTVFIDRIDYRGSVYR
jgi:mRNA-degrading endonuclease RelE of RelBE toxin-antitoxin system